MTKIKQLGLYERVGDRNTAAWINSQSESSRPGWACDIGECDSDYWLYDYAERHVLPCGHKAHVSCLRAYTDLKLSNVAGCSLLRGFESKIECPNCYRQYQQLTVRHNPLLCRILVCAGVLLCLYAPFLATERVKSEYQDSDNLIVTVAINIFSVLPLFLLGSVLCKLAPPLCKRITIFRSISQNAVESLSENRFLR